MDWKFERNNLLLCLLIGGVLGAFVGYTAWFIAAFLLGYIAFQLYRLQKLHNWAQGNELDSVPFEKGLLGQLGYQMYQFKKQRLAQKNSVSEQLERFRKLISIFPDGVVILSLSNEIKWFNDRASILLGLKKDDEGQLINHLIRHPHFTKLLNQSQKAGVLVMGLPVIESNWTAEKIEIRVLPYGYDERLLLVRDVTKVERTNQMRKDFVSNASHELRTPLTVLKGYVEMLLTDTSAGKERVEKSLQKVDQQVLKMQTMIDELLLLSKLEDSDVENSNNIINLHDLFEQLDIEFRPVAQQRKQALRFDMQPNVDLKGNKSSMLTVLRNLINNAINYTEQRGEVRVSWSLNDKGEGILSVSDTGKGIAARHLDRLTERFYRVPENNIMHKTGTGLGLAIVKHELERHEAQLIIDSKVGEGSQFQCLFSANRVNR
ncbi:MAG: two-component system phosphate regulon sensor histidine kinase PhoR [Cycloclasticus sp.]|jgi:two-component system phosphate regulon sensor histidine kinase PhoR